MFPQPIRHRRARRSDFDALSAILAANGLAALEPERGALRRFRRLVADLGADLYVAVAGAQVLGVVHVTYSRRLIGGPRARLELLLVDPSARGRGVGRGLAALAAARARRHGCSSLHGAAEPESAAGRFLVRLGWRTVGEEVELDLGDPPH
jgi:GNAT superfamily N-acetyltransferase